MGVELAVKITSPLTPDDKDLVSGIGVMTVAIANRELAAQGFSEAFAPEETKRPGPRLSPADASVPAAAMSADDGCDCSGNLLIERDRGGRHRLDPRS